ncbi:hypothetical protein B0H14DRAFT_2788870 [Mycena olivaceomarginata]|nr:hypothetical protein B0H14DRAFT_2788870 [Mycena olivaceomarginata]
MDWNPSISITVYFSRTGRSKARRSPLIVSALRCRTLFKESAERPSSLPSSPHPYIIMGVTVTVTSHGPQFLQKRNSKEQKLDKEGKPIESPHPHKGQVVNIFYHGFLYDSNRPDNKGDKFDSSYDRKEPFKTEIGVGKVIRGWDDGIVQLKEGDKATLLITPDYGYGARGFPPVIPANSTLIFEVELTEIPDLHRDE